MIDIKLIAIDMDHTLLNDKGQLPENFTDQVHALKEKGIQVAIASGRPLYTLVDMFSHIEDDLIFVSDNGAAITKQGEQLFNSIIDPDDYRKLMAFTLEQNEATGIPILCALDAAYISKAHDQYDQIYRTFYTNIYYFDDFASVDAVANKFTVYTPNNDAVDQYADIYGPALSKQFSATTSGKEWIDIMNKNIDKGQGMYQLSNLLNITTDQMMAFGDNYNDIEMLAAVKYSYAMENAHDDVKAQANFIAPSNNDLGVSKVIQDLLDGNL
ncbi:MULTISPECIES: HAD family hydrolase [Aerococcus]|uniref:HAD family hydrolase n=1 Tax=Aerococcus TaxID=1375 RepID=UPI0033643ACB